MGIDLDKNFAVWQQWHPSSNPSRGIRYRYIPYIRVLRMMMESHSLPDVPADCPSQDPRYAVVMYPRYEEGRKQP